MSDIDYSTYTLLIDCPDEKGLVGKIATTISETGLNMTSNDEFVDSSTEHFFMRSEVEGEFDEQQLLMRLQYQLPSTASIKLNSQKKKRLVILATKEYHCLGDLLLRHEFGELNAEIAGVISNHDTLRSLTERFGIPFTCIPHQGLEREEHEEKVLEAIHPYRPDFIVLAKYMRILTPQFVGNFPSKMINIHHSFLPAFIGANPYRQAYNRGVKMVGATAHFVNHELDEGPIIMQDIIHVNHSKTAKEMAMAGRDVEKVVLANALRLVLDDRVFVHKNKTIIFD